MLQPYPQTMGLLPYTQNWGLRTPGMPETFSPPPWVSDPDVLHGTWVTHMPRCILGSLTRGFLCRWRGKRSWHSRRMRNPQFCVSSKRPKGLHCRLHYIISIIDICVSFDPFILFSFEYFPNTIHFVLYKQHLQHACQWKRRTTSPMNHP